MDAVDQGTFVRAWAVQTRRIAWLLGAGASASAGLPTATHVRDDLLLRVYAERHGLVRQTLQASDPKVQEDLRQYFDGRNGMVKLGSSDDYSCAFELALPDEPTRLQYLRDRFKSGQPSYGQRVLGALISSGEVDVIATTNFDDLVEQAAAGAYAAVHSPADRRLLHVAALRSQDRARWVLEADSLPMLIKLHGDFRESALKNIDPELAEQDAVLRQAVNDASRTYGLAVAGYSGRDASVMSMLEQASDVSGAWPGGLWWFTREVHRTDPRVFELLDRARAAGTTAHLVLLGSFDELFGQLALQVDLSAQARGFVSQLRPAERVRAAAPPSGRQDFPLIRYNALPLLSAPTSALHAPLSGMKQRDFYAHLKDRQFRGAAAMNGGSLWAWSEHEPFATIAGASPETKTIDLTTSLEPGPQALALEGIAKALSGRLPTRMKSNRRGHAIVLTQFENPRDEHAATIAAFEKAYGGRLYGNVPGGIRLGANRKGEARRYAEGVRLHLEHRWGVTWLIFTPFTWVERWERPEGQEFVPDPINDWIRERWVGRKKNEVWADLIGAWSEALTPERRDRTLRLTRNLGGDTFGEFRLGFVSAYSRRAT